MAKPHIALFYTGGTIGMAPSAHGLAPSNQFPDMLQACIERARLRYPDLPDVSVMAYAQPIDSTNAMPSDWQRIGADIAQHYSAFDGFVVLHGTDTMAYTASALSFMLQGLRKPVVLSGAQIPLAVPDSDATANIVDALRIASDPQLAEVVICFGGHVMRGNCATKVSSQSWQAFSSPDVPLLATCDGEISWRREALLPPAFAERFALPNYGAAQILSLRFTPGMPVAVLEALLVLAPDALILECYGTGNVPDREPALREVLLRARENGVVVCARSQCLHGGTALGVYVAGSALAEAGVVGLGAMRFEAAFAKLHHLFALGHDVQAVRSLLLHDLAGESA